MLELSEVYRAQAKYGVSSALAKTERVTYEMYLVGCRAVLTDKTSLDYYSWDKKRQIAFTDGLIIDYVDNTSLEVDGFVDSNGDLMLDELIDRLRTDIVDFGILRGALEDEAVQEIQINDYKTIWIIKQGKAYLYTDKAGNPYQFISNNELHNTINRLIYSSSGSAPRMTTTNPLLNTRTASRGYRLSAVNDTAITPDMKVGYNFPVTSVTIRKYAPSMLTFNDFVRFNTLTEEMAEFLRLCGRADIRLICVGPTSSGKTTLLKL